MLRELHCNPRPTIIRFTEKRENVPEGAQNVRYSEQYKM